MISYWCPDCESWFHLDEACNCARHLSNKKSKEQKQEKEPLLKKKERLHKKAIFI